MMNLILKAALPRKHGTTAFGSQVLDMIMVVASTHWHISIEMFAPTFCFFGYLLHSRFSWHLAVLYKVADIINKVMLDDYRRDHQMSLCCL